MEANELQMIVDAVVQLGEQGKTAFIWWLVLDKLLPVIGWLLTLWALLQMAVAPLVRNLRASSILRQLRDQLGIGTPGILIDRELTELSKRLSELVRKEQQQ